MTNALVYLFGYPGVGKNTIAGALEKQSGGKLIAIQNHLLSNAFRHVAAYQPKENYAQIEPLIKHHTMKAWLNFLDFIDAALPQQGLIFTSVLYDDPDRIEYFDYIANWALQQNRPFHPVRLSCSPDEVIRRAQSPERDKAFKLTDGAVLENIIATNDLMTPDQQNFFDLDVTQLSAAQAAESIILKI